MDETSRLLIENVALLCGLTLCMGVIWAAIGWLIGNREETISRLIRHQRNDDDYDKKG